MRRRAHACFLGFGLAAASLVGGPASAQQLIDATDVGEIREAMEDLGYRAEFGVDSYGDPMLYGRASRSLYALYFYGCVNNDNCKILQFSSAWDLPGGLTLERANDWNVDQLWGQAYVLDDGDPALSFVFNLEGGISRRAFQTTVRIWQATLAEFERFIGFTAGKPSPK